MNLNTINDINVLKRLLKDVTVEVKKNFTITTPNNCKPPLTFEAGHRYFYEQVDDDEYRVYMDESEGLCGWEKENAYALFTTKEMREYGYLGEYITKEMVKLGYNRNIIRLIASPHNDGIVCQIGEHWFYFGGYMAEQFNQPEDFIHAVPKEDIINDIFVVLDTFGTEDREIFGDEYLYYLHYLQDNGVY